MPTEVIVAIVGAAGAILGIAVGALANRTRTAAEIDKYRAEADKTRAEAERIKAETLRNTTQGHTSSDSFQKEVASVTIVTAGPQSYSQFNLAERLNGLRTLDVSAYNLANLFHDLRESLVESIVHGAVVRVLVVDHESLAHQLMLEHSRRPDLLLISAVEGLLDITDIQQRLRARLADKQRVAGKLEVRTTSWLSSCNLILVDAREASGIGKIGLRPPAYRYTEGRLSLLLSRKENPTIIDYFAKSFEVLWQEDSGDWNGTIPSQPTGGEKRSE